MASQDRGNNSNRNHNHNNPSSNAYFTNQIVDQVIDREYKVDRDAEITSPHYLTKYYTVKYQRSTPNGLSNDGIYDIPESDLKGNLLREVFDLGCELRVESDSDNGKNNICYGLKPLAIAFQNGLHSNTALAIDALNLSDQLGNTVPAQNRSSREYGPEAMETDSTLSDYLITGTGCVITDMFQLHDQRSHISAYFVEFVENATDDQMELRHQLALALPPQRYTLAKQMFEYDAQCRFDRGRWFDCNILINQYPQMAGHIRRYKERCIQIRSDPTGVLYASSRRPCDSSRTRLHSLWIACTMGEGGCQWGDQLGVTVKIVDLAKFRDFIARHTSREYRDEQTIKDTTDEKQSQLSEKQDVVHWINSHLLSFEVHDSVDGHILLEHPAFQRERCLIHLIGTNRSLNDFEHDLALMGREGVIVTKETQLQQQQKVQGKRNMDLDKMEQ